MRTGKPPHRISSYFICGGCPTAEQFFDNKTMAINRETCVFHLSWFEAIETLPKAVQGEAYRAIMMYALRGVEIEEQGQMTRLIMAIAKPVIDTNNKRYENGCKGGEYGKLGGRPKTPNKPQNNPKETPNKPQNNPTCELGVLGGVLIKDKSLISNREIENIFNIFYFSRNLKFAKEEFERFINHYEANGWCRGNSDKPIKNKEALAKSWKVEREEKRYPDKIMAWLYDIYLQAKAEGKATDAIISGIDRVMEENGKAIIVCNRQAYELCEMYSPSIKRDFKHSYRVRKEA